MSPLWVGAAIVALLLAGVFAAGLAVPRQRPPGIRGAILRWGHALTWILLAATFGALATESSEIAGPLGLAALAAYLVFLVTLASARRANRGDSRD